MTRRNRQSSLQSLFSYGLVFGARAHTPTHKYTQAMRLRAREWGNGWEGGGEKGPLDRGAVCSSALGRTETLID